MFNDTQLVIIYDKDDQPLTLTSIESVKSKHVVVMDTNFSLATGKILGKQPEYSGRYFTYPALVPKDKDLVKNIASRIEIFDTELLQDKTIENHKFYLDVNTGITVAEMMSEIQSSYVDENIPEDANIVSMDGTEIRVSYTRKETIREYDYRVFRAPIIEKEKKAKELAELNEQAASLKSQLQVIEDKAKSLS